MLGIGLILLGAGCGGFAVWKLIIPFNRMLKFSEENVQTHFVQPENKSIDDCVDPGGEPQVSIDPAADAAVRDALVKLSSAVKRPVPDHALAR